MTDLDFTKIDDLLESGCTTESVAILEDAASAGNADAMVELGRLYFISKHVAPDSTNTDRAREWFEKADKYKHRDAPYYIGLICTFYGDHKVPTDGHIAERKLSDNIAQEWYETAMSFYRRAAKRGSHYALARIGYNYLHGIGVEQSADRAFQYFQQGAAAGNIGAYIMISRMLILGHSGIIGFFKGLVYIIRAFVRILRLRMTESVEQIHRRFEY